MLILLPGEVQNWDRIFLVLSIASDFLLLACVNEYVNKLKYRTNIRLLLQWYRIALMQVFPKPIVLTTKPRIDAIRSLYI